MKNLDPYAYTDADAARILAEEARANRERLRDEMAMAVFPVVAQRYGHLGLRDDAPTMAECAYVLADAMLKAREAK